MAAAGLNEYRVARLHGVPLAVQLHLARTFENVINLGHPFVIVRTGVLMYVEQMDRRDLVGVVGERASRLAARAGDGRERGEMGDAVSGFVVHGVTLIAIAGELRLAGDQKSD